MIECVKAELILAFLIANMRLISFYLGLKIEQNHEQKTIKLFQSMYINKVLVKFHLNKAYPINTPIKENTPF